MSNPQRSLCPEIIYRPDIDGLRAIAILSVVAFHAFPRYVPGGFIGVDIFFVISGYLITSLIIRHLAFDDFSFIDFYQRRIRRIFPALMLVLFSCLAFGSQVLYVGENQQLGKHVLAGAGFVSNLVLWAENGYFDNSADTKPLLHLWSLGIEEQFYIGWPVLLCAAFRFRINLIALIAIIGVVSFALNVTEVGPNAVATFYSPHTRFWELLIGALLAVITVRALTSTQKSACSIGGATLIVVGLLILDSGRAFPGWWALLPTAGAALVIAAGPTALINRFLSDRSLVWIGLISFPLYLWHWPLLSFARILRGQEPTLLLSAALVISAVVLAWATYRWIELPIRTGSHANSKTSALAGVAIIFGVIGFIQYNSTAIGITEDAHAIAQFAGPSTPWKYGINKTCTKQYPFDDVKDYGWWFCMLEREAPPTVLLLGDSLTNDFFPGLAQNDNFAKQNFLSIGTCGPAWSEKLDPAPAISISPCSGNRPYDQMMFINQIVDRTPTLKFAIVGSLPATFPDSYIEALRKRIAFLESHDIRVIVFSAKVPLGYDNQACFRPRLGGGQPASCEVNAAVHDEILRDFARLQSEITKTNPQTLFYDASAFYCGTTTCSFKLNGMPIYRDGLHLSEYASQELSRHFSTWAASNVPSLLTPLIQAPD